MRKNIPLLKLYTNAPENYLISIQMFVTSITIITVTVSILLYNETVRFPCCLYDSELLYIITVMARMFLVTI
jgi:hypothetical protein